MYVFLIDILDSLDSNTVHIWCKPAYLLGFNVTLCKVWVDKTLHIVSSMD